jgi:mRNA interferase HicA
MRSQFSRIILIWINPQTGVIEAIPRHTEIKELLAKKILKSLNAQ